MSKNAEQTTIAPDQLVTAANLRSDLALTKEFVGSIKDRGVIQPLVARRVGDQLHLLAGHRRAAAAIEAGLSEVPVMVLPEASTEAEAGEVERILDQHAENTHRAGLTEADEAGVIEQLAAFGLSVTQIARRTRTKKARVEAAMQVQGSDLASKAIDRYGFLTINQAATLAEFDTDEDTATALVAAAKDGRFEHVAQRARDERTWREAESVLIAELTEAGTPIVEPPSYYNEGNAARLSQLVDAQGEQIPEEAHRSCPGRAVAIGRRRDYETDTEVPVAMEVCTDPAGNGHRDVYRGGSGAAAGPLSEEEKAERRQLRENNTAWRSAETVRREWLAEFVSRKTPPKDAMPFLATALLSADVELRKAMETSWTEAALLTGGALATVDRGYRTSADGDYSEASNAAATRALLAAVLGAYESRTGVHTWRNPDAGIRRYLLFLTTHGYEASEIEQEVIDA